MVVCVVQLFARGWFKLSNYLIYPIIAIICRWDESAVSLLPEYLRMYYIKLLSNYNDIENILEPSVKYRMAYVKRQVPS